MIENYIVLDLETTGLSRSYHKITEIGAIKVRNNTIVDKFEKLVNPEVHIPSFITKLTGISDDMVKNERTIKDILPELKSFLENNPVIAHNASFDRGFLEHNFNIHMNHKLNNEFLCTKKLATRILPNLSSRKLSSIAEHFSIKNEMAHRALSDVITTNQIFTIFNEMLHEKGIKEKEEVLKFQNTPKRKLSDLF